MSECPTYADDDNLTAQEAAEYLRLHVVSLRRLRRKKIGPAWRRKGEGTGHIIYKFRDLTAWERARQGAAQEEQAHGSEAEPAAH